ncbi:hypothetical protein THASP1DRAFT_26461 [Thamnocephalis sphaerospora]|uniref:Uncharacterized protein n=1 Tax=Thamnocephalis sphaerospora TaxID=78915 RepID=A0A4P9XH61_9FUNG|nr:hypothetical protein THASP1DRAFT_26461 [Thamnocephalis sphaerospora]|eukprot:RKP04982.1 hypothetical protein THASP1DRAFT_26461 [Thamnocephalis sphaerospora]
MASPTVPTPKAMTPYVEDVDLSGFKGINLTLLQPSPLSRVVGEWDAIELGSAADYREIVIGLIPVVLLAIRFGCNTYMATRMLYNRREVVFWLNLVQAVVGVIASVCAVVRGLAPWAISCHAVAYSAALGTYIGTSAIVCILFAKAYYGTKRSRVVLCFGIASIALTFAVGLMANWAQAAFEYGSRRCATALDYRWIIAKFTVDMASNISLSGCFLYAMWVQGRSKKQPVFWVLFQDGLIYGFGSIVSNITATTMVLTMHSLTFWHSHLYGIDCTNAKLQTRSGKNAKSRRTGFDRQERLQRAVLPIGQREYW